MRKFFLSLLLPCLMACSSSGGLVTAPTTPEQKVATAYVTLDQLTIAATQAVKAKKLSSADGQHVLDSVKLSQQGVDIARDLAKVDPKAADAKITAELAIIKALEDYLASKGQ